MSKPLDPKTDQLDPQALSRSGWQLIVLGEQGLVTHQLPERGRVVVGRASDADVAIHETSISRRHLLIHLGPNPAIEDLGSSNGTQLGGRSLVVGQRVPVQAGDSLQVGKTMCVLLGPGLGGLQARLVPPADFEARIEAECLRAPPAPLGFTVLCLRAARTSPALEEALAATFSSVGTFAMSGRGAFEALLLDCAAEQADARVRAVTTALAPWAPDLQVGTGCFPRDGQAAGALLAHARRELRPAAPAPGGPAGAGEGLVIADEEMQKLHETVGRIARGCINVLVLGETGVGKEIFAERLHALSPRAGRLLVRLNCAGFSEALVENELFGHEKGAFTGASEVKVGLLELAAGGTVFLDEIGELPVSLQAKLLRVIEERSMRRVGGTKPIAIDVRFVAATNRDLEAEVSAGRFRQDLYFRLNGYSFTIPPLRERLAELELLAQRFLRAACAQLGVVSTPPIAEESLAVLRAYRWPGNIRELRNVIERAVLLSAGQTLRPEHLPLERMTPHAASPPTTPAPVPALVAAGAAEGGSERARVVAALAEANGNQSRAAQLLGVSRRTLITKIEKYGLPRPQKR